MAVVLVLAGALMLASGAMASALPRLFSRLYCGASSCTGVFTLQPHNITALNDPQGGAMTQLSWSSWTKTSATATGTAVISNMGTTNKTPVDVSASRPRNGLFTRLTITFMPTSEPSSVEKLKLVNGNPPNWKTTST